MCARDLHLDTENQNTVGQLHAIFVSKGKRALLLGADVQLGEPNAQIGKYIDFLKAKRGSGPLPIIDNAMDAAEVAEKAVLPAISPLIRLRVSRANSMQTACRKRRS